MLTSVSARAKSTLVEQQTNEESSVSQTDLEVAIQAEQIANILNHTICKTELVVSPMNISAVMNTVLSVF
jgi:hypothetical protein